MTHLDFMNTPSIQGSRTGPAVTRADADQLIRLIGKYPPILGIVGPLGCGKTTQADAIVKLVGGKRQSCAGPIRSMLMTLGVSEIDLTQHKNKSQDWLHGRTPREMMKSLGTEWGRQYVGESIWINAVLRAASELGQQRVPVVIDDIRFDNEARAVKEAGGHLIYISRPYCSYTYEHPSECGLSDGARKLVDGVLDLKTGLVPTRGTEVEEKLVELKLPHRPWWANYRLGRLYARWRNERAPRSPVGESFGVTPELAADRVVAVWNRLANGDVLPGVGSTAR